MKISPWLIALGAIALAPIAAPVFTPAQPELFSAGGSFANAFADFDGDNDLDIFVGFNGAPNRLYRNNNGVFEDVASTFGVADARPARAAAWGDFDSDGDSDLLVGFAPLPAAAAAAATPAAASVLRVYRNDGTRFADVTEQLGLLVNGGAVRQPAWIDFDSDGDLDLFVAFRDRANTMFRSERGRFVDVAASVGLADTRRTVGAVWFDFDADGDLDAYVGNMDGDANALMRNDAGRFLDVAESAGVAWGGRAPSAATNGTVRPCVADVNNDGAIDILTANYGRNGLFLNRGSGRFEDASEQWGIAIDSRYDACALSDFDNDGRVDLYVNGTVTGGMSYRDYLFQNNGTRFVDVTPENILALKADHGVQWGDFDNDGDEDLALTGSQADGMHSMMRNMLAATEAQRSIHVRVVDSRGRSTFAGAEIRVYAAGTRGLIATRLVDSGSGYDSQNDMPTHVGVGNKAVVDVEVIFPSAGRRQIVRTAGVRVADQRGRAVVVRVGG